MFIWIIAIVSALSSAVWLTDRYDEWGIARRWTEGTPGFFQWVTPRVKRIGVGIGKGATTAIGGVVMFIFELIPIIIAGLAVGFFLRALLRL